MVKHRGKLRLVGLSWRLIQAVKFSMHFCQPVKTISVTYYEDDKTLSSLSVIHYNTAAS